METVAPGIWKTRFGQPEAHTASRYHTRKPLIEPMQKLPEVKAHPLSLASIKSRQTARGIVLEFPLSEGEELYGLGLQLQSHRQSGSKKKLAVNSDPRADTGDSHAPVPLLVSSGGWALLVDTLRYATFYCASHQKVSDDNKAAQTQEIAISTEDLYAQRKLSQRTVYIEIPGAQGVDIFLFGGPSPLNAVQRYNLYSGGGCLPPLWGLGVWYRGYGPFHQDEALELAKQFRERKLPCDVFGLEPGWQTQVYSCSFVWSDERFPNPEGFLKATDDMGFKVNLWEHAYVHPSSPMYPELKPHSGDFEVWSGLVPDFTTAEAQRIFADHHDKELIDKGVSGFKLDECDDSDFVSSDWGFPLLAEFPSGLDGEQMHSLLGTKYMECLESVYRSKNKRSYGSVRNAHAFASSHPFVLYSDLYNHRDFVRGVVNMGFSGLLWTPEVRHADSCTDLRRRVQSTLFSPMALINGWYIKNPPWLQMNRALNNEGQLQDGWEELEASCRKAFECRMSLLPYLYTAFARYHFEGIPPFRALVMDWPEDPETHNLDDQYMMGDDLLVAPMFADQEEREVYLPAGRWHDFYTGQVYEGGTQITVKPGVDEIPVFVKDGTLLPLAEPVQHVAADTVFKLTLRAFGDEPREAVLYEDDGETFNYEKAEYNWVTVRKGGSLSRQGNCAQHRYRLAE